MVCGVVEGRGRHGDPRVGFCAVARSLRNGDAGDSDARHLADGHLEQEIQHLEGFAVPTCQWAGGVHGVIFAVGLDR